MISLCNGVHIFHHLKHLHQTCHEKEQVRNKCEDASLTRFQKGHRASCCCNILIVWRYAHIFNLPLAKNQRRYSALGRALCCYINFTISAGKALRYNMEFALLIIDLTEYDPSLSKIYVNLSSLSCKTQLLKIKASMLCNWSNSHWYRALLHCKFQIHVQPSHTPMSITLIC